MRVIPDTNVWITWSARAPEDLSLGDRGDALPFLATITLQELWAGARSTADRAYCERLLVEAQRHGKLLNPPAAAWILAGQALGVLARGARWERRDCARSATTYCWRRPHGRMTQR